MQDFCSPLRPLSITSAVSITAEQRPRVQRKEDKGPTLWRRGVDTTHPGHREPQGAFPLSMPSLPQSRDPFRGGEREGLGGERIPSRHQSGILRVQQGVECARRSGREHI
jgi:hypothetical protein